MTGMTVIIFSSGTRTSQLTVPLELQTQSQPKQFTTLLFLALLCLRRLHLLISRRRATTHQMAVSSTFRAASTRAGTSTLTAGEQAAPYSLMRLDLEILTVAVPAERALLRTSASMATIGQPALIPHPTVVACTSVRVSWARRVRSSVRTGSPSVRSQNKFDYLII